MTDRGLRFIGEGLAFAALVSAATCLEINGLPAAGLWVMVVLWVIFSWM